MAAASEATLVFTDIVDSTRVVEQLGDTVAADLWARHDRRVRDLLHEHRGREIDRTDGFFAIFDRAADAATFATACHLAVSELELRARVALHTGTVTLRENDPVDVARGAKPLEIDGLAKPFAARLNALASPGQTLASAAACAALGGAAGALRSHGHYRLKGVAEPVEVFELGHGGAPAFAPPADTEKAYRVVRGVDGIGGVWRPVREVQNNLPAERDAFVGRAAELHALSARLDRGRASRHRSRSGRHRQDPIRAALRPHLARRLARRRVLLRPQRSPNCRRRARRRRGRARVPLGSDDTVAQLGHAIAARGSCLVVLDNVEQVLDPAAAALSRWLDRAAGARFVVTSRERLRVDGEGLLSLEALPLDGVADGAAALFVARARLQLPGFAADEAQHGEVAKIVRLLDGMPLAIELAAARVRLLSPAQIVARLRDRFALLAGARGAAARQATLRGAIDWSWELLSSAEQAAFASAPCSRAVFTLAAAEAVLDIAGREAAAPPMDIVQSLLDKSLLRVWHSTGQADEAEPRFGMYVSLHEYARERLEASGDRPATELRHGLHFAAFGSADALDALGGEDAPRRRRALAAELDNLVVACWRGLARSDAETAASSYAAAWAVLELQGPRALGIALGKELAATPMPPGPRTVVLGTYGKAQQLSGELERGATTLLEALAVARSSGDRRAEGWILGQTRRHPLRPDARRRSPPPPRRLARRQPRRRRPGHRSQDLCRLAALAHVQGRWNDFETVSAAALAFLREAGRRPLEPALLTMSALREHGLGHTQQAMALSRRATEIAREMGDRSATAVSLCNAGAMLLDLGRDAEALPALLEALAIQREVGSRSNESIVLGTIGLLYQQQGRADEARAHFEAA
jgi:predicted ATPase/class 3 adenylate cyclase